MPNYTTTNRKFPFLRDFSDTEVQSTEKAILFREQHLCKINEMRSQKADTVIDDCNRRFHDLLGANNLKILKDTMLREHIHFRELLQPPIDQPRNYKELNNMRKQKLNTLIREFGTSPDQLSAIGNEAVSKIKEIFSPVDGKVFPGYSMSNNLQKWIELSPLHKFPIDWGGIKPDDDPSDPHRWFLFMPPFFGFLFHFDHLASENYIADRLLYLMPASGLTGNETILDCTDASDFDYASATADSQIAFAFVPPVTGVIEVLIDAQNTYGTHDLIMRDEYGWSNSSTGQSNYLMMNVLHPNVIEPSIALMSSFHKKFESDSSNDHEEGLIRGQHYFAQLFSAGPVQGGQSVIITVGTRNFDSSAANDVTVHSKSNFQWFINSVEVRVSP